MAAVPMIDLQIVDDWHTSGLKGSGSITTVANGPTMIAANAVPQGCEEDPVTGTGKCMAVR